MLGVDVRHELSCVSCGAPLHDLKLMPVSAPEVPPVEVTSKKTIKPGPKSKQCKQPKVVTSKKGKRRKFGMKLGRKLSVSRLVSKVLDEIEDVVEDILH